MTLSAFLSPIGFPALLLWCFLVLAAAQLTIRLIMAFSVRPTLVAACVMAAASLPVAALYDALIGPAPSFGTRLDWAPVPLVAMGLVGFAIARWLLRFKRLRGQVITGCMVGVLAPHNFMLVPI